MLGLGRELVMFILERICRLYLPLESCAPIDLRKMAHPALYGYGIGFTPQGLCLAGTKVGVPFLIWVNSKLHDRKRQL